MSIVSEIQRIQEAKEDIKTSIQAKGVTLSDDASISEFSSAIDRIQTGGAIIEPTTDDMIDFLKSMEDHYEEEGRVFPLTFQCVSDFAGDDEECYICIKSVGTTPRKQIYYRVSDENGNLDFEDESAWMSYTKNAKIYCKKGTLVQFKGDSVKMASSDSQYRQFVTIGGAFICGGSVMSLLDFSENIEVDHAFCFLFKGTSIIRPPKLPATTLGTYAYRYMFQGCSILKTAPELPATELTIYCYQYMFDGCVSLEKAPYLPAETLVNYCYQYMFKGCLNLNYIKAAFTAQPSTTQTSNWVSGVSDKGTFYQPINSTWATTGVSAMPSGWTREFFDPNNPQ